MTETEFYSVLRTLSGGSLYKTMGFIKCHVEMPVIIPETRGMFLFLYIEKYTYE